MNDVESVAGSLAGHCLCGAVSVEASDLAPQVHICHCNMCRRWNGGPSVTVIAKSAKFEGEEHISLYDSSEWAQRSFCSKCGSNLCYRFNQSSDWFLWAGLFDGVGDFSIAQEIYVDSKPSGYSFVGNHPRLTEDEFLESIGMKPS